MVQIRNCKNTLFLAIFQVVNVFFPLYLSEKKKRFTDLIDLTAVHIFSGKRKTLESNKIQGFLPCADKKDAARNGAPHSRVALFRSASVLLQKKTLAEKEPFAPSMLNFPGFHKNNHT